MKNKIIQNIFFLFIALIFSSSLHAAKTVNESCEKYMREVILLTKKFKSESTIKHKLNNMVKGKKLNQYLQNQWLSIVKNDKSMTPNGIYLKKKELLKECVAFVKG